MKTPKRNDAFTCEQCGEKNPPALRTCRNHCRKCLFSKHLDRDLPGDRIADCRGLMEPLRIEQHPKKEWMIVHSCRKCGRVQRNKVAADDDFETVLKVASKAQ